MNPIARITKRHIRSTLSIAVATLVPLAGAAVYASTSVSAAPASNSVQATPSLIGRIVLQTSADL